MGLELHTMDHQYGVPASDLRHHVHFQHYWAINRSQVTYDTLWLMSFTWHAIGVDFEDYVGCDTTLNMGFAYNADAFDQWPSGYGEHPPALGILALNAPLAAFRPYTAGGVSGKPSTPEQYLFAAKGQLLNGSTVVDPITNQESLHWYAGDPADPSQWSEVSEMNYPEDRRTISTYGPWYNVAPGDTVCLDLAFVFAQDTLGDNLSSVTLLKQRAAAVKAWYDQQTLGCGQYIALDVTEPGTTSQVRYYSRTPPRTSLPSVASQMAWRNCWSWTCSADQCRACGWYPVRSTCNWTFQRLPPAATWCPSLDR